MSDPLSVAAGVAGLVSLGIQLAQGLYTLADGIGSAGIQVRSLALEVSTFAKLLGKVRQELLENDPRNAQTDIVHDILEVCEQVLEPLQTMQKRLSALLVRFRNSPSKLRNLGLRVQWIFSTKSKMLWLRGVLNVQHQVLDTVLELIILQTTKDRSQQNIANLTIVLDMSVQGIRGMLQNVRHGIEQSDILMLPAAETAATPDAEADSDDSPANDLDRSGSMQSALIVRPQQDSEIDRLAGEVEEDFDAALQQNGEAMWDDTRAVSRKVVRRAKAAMEEPLTSDERSVHPGTVAGDAFANLHEVPSSSARSAVNATRDITHLDASATPMTPAPSSLESERCLFIDADARRYYLPGEHIRKFEHMEQVLLSLYPAGPVYNLYDKEVRNKHTPANALIWNRHDAVSKREFDLLSADGVVLLPKFWSSLISREREIRIRFSDDSINGKSSQEDQTASGSDNSTPNTDNASNGKLRKLFGGRSR